MSFDLATAQPVQTGFDLASAKPVSGSAPIPATSKPSMGTKDYLAAIPEAAGYIGSGALSGIAGGLSAAGSSIENAGRWALNKLGANLPGVDPLANLQKVQSDMTYQPRTQGGRNLSNAVSYPARKYTEMANAAGQGTSNLTGSPLLGTIADVGMQAAPYALGAGATRFLPEAAPVVSKTLSPEVAQAAGLGYRLTPEQAQAGMAARTVQSLTNSAKLERSMSQKNATVTNSLARQDLGLSPGTSITQSELTAAKAPANAVYNAVSKVGKVTTDDTYRQQIAQVSNRTGSGSFAFDTPTDIGNLKTQYGTLEDFDAGDGVQKIRQLRADASNNIGAPHAPERNALGFAQRQIADALEDQLDRHIQSGAFEGPGGGIQSDLIGQFRDARQQLARIRSVEDALDGRNVSARSLAQQLDRGVPLSGNLRSIAQAYGNFDRSLQDVSKIRDSGPLSALDRSVALPLSLAHPAAALSILAPPLARAALSSGRYQKYGIAGLPMGLSPSLQDLSLLGGGSPLLTQQPQGLMQR